MQNVTIVDVAKRAGISVSTVSRVLNGSGYVSEDARARIERAMRELEYVPSTIARSMRDKRTRTIAIFIPEYSNVFYSEMLSALMPKAAELDYMIITCSTNQDAKYETEYIEQLLSRSIDGIIFFTYGGIRGNLAYITKLSNRIPIVFMDSVFEHEPVSVVSTDGWSGTKKAVSHLIDLGHRRIGYLKISDDYFVAERRYEGYVAALEEADLEPDPALVYGVKLDDIQRRAHEAGAYFLGLSERPTAIVAVDDMFAIGIMNYLKLHDVAIPEGMAVVGFDDIALSRIVSPSLTTVAQPIHQLAHEALKLLIETIADHGISNRKLQLDTKLIVRRSTDPSKPLIAPLDPE
jgi:DNA-binding LacI/PurR family transcriptional regulator